jgi:hypothetical protein
MSDWTSGIGAGLAAVLTPLVVRALVARTGAGAAKEGDAFVLRYGGAWTGFVIVSAIVMVGGASAVLLFADLDDEGRRIWFGIAALFGLLFGLAAVETTRVGYRVDERGIERRTPWSRHVLVPWSEIVEVRYEPTARLYMRARSGEKLRLSVYLTGLGTVAKEVLAHVPPGVIDDRARGALSELAQGR